MARPFLWLTVAVAAAPGFAWIVYRLAKGLGFLEPPSDREQMLTVQSPLSVGQFAGKWCSYNAPPDLPYDQREEDGGSLTFDGDVLAERMEILGAPQVDLEFAVDQPVAMVAVRLSDVAPDGRATSISYGLLNLTHRAGHDRRGCRRGRPHADRTAFGEGHVGGRQAEDSGGGLAAAHEPAA